MLFPADRILEATDDLSSTDSHLNISTGCFINQTTESLHPCLFPPVVCSHWVESCIHNVTIAILQLVVGCLLVNCVMLAELHVWDTRFVPKSSLHKENTAPL